MKNYFKIALLTIALGTFFTSCDSDDPLVGNTEITFTFSHHFDGADVSLDEFNIFKYENENGDTLSISKLRYLISDISLQRLDGSFVHFEGHQLVDLSQESTLTISTGIELARESYRAITFTYGFDSLDNTGNYVDLNAANWNWPAGLGGGYHYMQMEGMFKDNGVETIYAYHQGLARKEVGVFEQNFIDVEVLKSFTLDKANLTVDIQMDVSEWYKNPNLWDLGTLNSMLMPNYDAQIMMNENGQNVFDAEVAQTD